MLKVPTHVAASGELHPSAVFSEPEVALLWSDPDGDGSVAEYMETLTPENPTIIDREVDEDGGLLEPGHWDLDEADGLLNERGYRRTDDWQLAGEGYYHAPVETLDDEAQRDEEPQVTMTPYEVGAARALLGLTIPAAGEALGINPETFRNWEYGRAAIPEDKARQLYALIEQTARVVYELKREMEALVTREHPNSCVLSVPRADVGAPEGMPASWWRMVAARVQADLPVIRIANEEAK